MICYHAAILMGVGPQSAASAGAAPSLRFAGCERLLGELFERSGAARFGIARAQFEGVLEGIAGKYLPAGAGTDETRELLSSLRVQELALARACAAGNEQAWEEFLTRYRAKLFEAAAGIARDDGTARELADSLYADLYGATAREGHRVSKLESYTGRGSLEGWLRTVLAQEFVNRYRRQRRLVSLEKQEEAGTQFVAVAADPAVAPDARLEAAIDEALAQLGAEERFIIAAYFLDGRKLAEIARLLRVHESTISRKVEKITSALRKQVRDGLQARGMSRRQADEAMETDVRDLRVDVRTRLAQETCGPTFSGQGQTTADGKND